MTSVYLTVLPSQFATGLLTAGIAFSYQRLGVGAVGLAAVVLFVFQYLLKAGVEAYDRGEQLEQRTRSSPRCRSASSTRCMQTLSMRDAMTARHSAAVARYAREVARLLGLSEREQDLIHTAGLFHDIGKFIFPDSILVADRKLTDEEWETVKLHPEQGAKLVRRIEGYGPVADIVLSHHERIDGRGYPYGLSGEQIPLGSRILAAADTYDVMTARDSYRDPVSSEEALAELRRVAGSQLDPMVVDTFVEMIERHGVAFRHTDETDFERELAFERRVKRLRAAQGRPPHEHGRMSGNGPRRRYAVNENERPSRRSFSSFEVRCPYLVSASRLQPIDIPPHRPLPGCCNTRLGGSTCSRHRAL